jgi:8-oxo-dGTP pyrophosphatase MutT (NUDIX family)
MPREKTVGAIIFRKENGERLYLLLQYRRKHWEFVKGHIDSGETDQETLRREAREEAGIEDLEIIPGFKEYTKYFFRQYEELVSEEDKKKGKIPWVFKLVTFYLAETKTKDIKLSWEHQDYKWLPFTEALKQTTYKGSKEILQKAHNFLEK